MAERDVIMVAKDMTYKQLFRAYIRKFKRFVLNTYEPYQWTFIILVAIIPFLPVHGNKFNPVSVLLMVGLFEVIKALERGDI